MQWIVLLFRVPTEPSRHRVAVWRELRRTGAVSVGQSAWLAPAAPAFADGIGRAVELVQAAGGEAMVLDAAATSRPTRSGWRPSTSLPARPNGSSSFLSAASTWRDRQGDRQEQADPGRAGRGGANPGAATSLAPRAAAPRRSAPPRPPMPTSG